MTYGDLKEHIVAIAKYCDRVKCDDCLFAHDYGYYCILRDVRPRLWEGEIFGGEGA